jgi:predicted dehydrogenase
MLLVGAGLMGRTHLEAAKGLDSVEYVGVVDINEKAARALSAEFGMKAFGDLSVAIEELKPDAVDVCVPTPYHLPTVKICASAKVHVLCEKPITLTLEDAVEMERLEADGIRIMIAQVIRFWPEYRLAREIVREKQYGQIRAIDCRRLSSPPDWNTWMLKREFSGGAVLDMQIHDMDFVLQMLGRPRAVQAWGTERDGTFNSVQSRLIYPSGIPVRIEASMIMPPSYPFRMYFSIELDGAVLEMDFWRAKGERLMIYPQDGEAFSPEPDERDAYADEIDYFARQVKAGKPFDLVALDESILALEMCLASEQSCLTGKPFNL